MDERCGGHHSALPCVVIGAGVSGLRAAKKLCDAGHEIIIFEKQAAIGGCWHNHGNHGSFSQVPAAFYRVHTTVREDFTARADVLDDMAQQAADGGFSDCIRFNKVVTRIEDTDTAVQLEVIDTSTKEAFTVRASRVFLCQGGSQVPRRQATRDFTRNRSRS